MGNWSSKRNMSMPATDDAWAKAYALQALSDLNARDQLASANAEKCHRLHFLQMAAEKTCKAHLIKRNGHESVRRSHAYVSKNLPIIAKVFYAQTNSDNQVAKWQVAEITRIAHEIEVLAPACDDGEVREDNSEYPWINGQGEIVTPCNYNFPNIDDSDRTITLLIRLMRAASEAYSR
jgi:hypothetical protein